MIERLCDHEEGYPPEVRGRDDHLRLRERHPHPFHRPYYTGKKTVMDTEGRIDKFMQRYGKK